jgi:hypothetical protein
VNSEELELSLKTDFENYLKDLFAEMRQNAAELQQNFETELEKHRSQVDEAIRLFAQRFENSPQLDAAFSQSIVEHLRLSKDSGAELAAMAFSEAEKLSDATPPAGNYDKLRDAVDDISSKTSQSTILTALVDHAAQFAPRGVFFIVKNSAFVAWKRFGQGNPASDTGTSHRFELGESSVLSVAISNLKTAQASYDEQGPDREFVESLELGRADRMYAIPLVARGRGVAVMYVDYGIEGTQLNIEALEMLVRVAGLSVELLAASQAAPAAPQISEHAAQPAVTEVKEEAGEVYTGAAAEESSNVYEETYQAEPETFSDEADTKEYSFEMIDSTEVSYDAEPAEEAAEVEQPQFGSAESGFAFSEQTQTVEVEDVVYDDAVTETVEAPGFQMEHTDVEASEPAPEEAGYGEIAAVDEAYSVPTDDVSTETEEVTYFDSEDEAAETIAEPASTDFAFQTNGSYSDEVSHETVEQPQPVAFATPEPEVAVSGYQPETVSVPVVELGSSQPRTRFGDRNMDLPIEVPEEERRLHNDARRFARLLVSEIKLYNEQKVSEGREAGDLYDRLREAIDRSREMYDKRVQPTVAAKFDYFHFELINNLAEGQDAKLGANYHGVTV